MNILRRMAVGLALVSMACGGRTDPDEDGGPGAPGAEEGGGGSSGTGSSGAGSSGTGSSGTVTFSPCPTDVPSPGSECTGPNQEACTYPTFSGGCQSFVCNGASLWVSAPGGC